MNRKKYFCYFRQSSYEWNDSSHVGFGNPQSQTGGVCCNKINLYEKELSFCTGCRACMDTHICVQRMIYKALWCYCKSAILLFLPPLSIGQMCQLLSKTYLTDCWSCYGRNRHISQTTFAGKAIYTFNFL